MLAYEKEEKVKMFDPTRYRKGVGFVDLTNLIVDSWQGDSNARSDLTY